MNVPFPFWGDAVCFKINLFVFGFCMNVHMNVCIYTKWGGLLPLDPLRTVVINDYEIHCWCW